MLKTQEFKAYGSIRKMKINRQSIAENLKDWPNVSDGLRLYLLIHIKRGRCQSLPSRLIRG